MGKLHGSGSKGLFPGLLGASGEVLGQQTETRPLTAEAEEKLVNGHPS